MEILREARRPEGYIPWKSLEDTPFIKIIKNVSMVGNYDVSIQGHPW